MKEIEKLFKTEFDYVEEFRFFAKKLGKTFRIFPLFVVERSSGDEASFHHYVRRIFATAKQIANRLQSVGSQRPSQIQLPYQFIEW